MRIGLTYTPGTKPGVLVLPVNGEHGDSVRAILQRNLDFGDRVNVIALDAASIDSASDGSRGVFNYPLYARLGAAAMVQATMTETGMHVAIHDVAKQRVERVRDFSVAEAALSGDWRMAMHAISDELEFLISGVRGMAATRILFSSAASVGAPAVDLKRLADGTLELAHPLFEPAAAARPRADAPAKPASAAAPDKPWSITVANAAIARGTIAMADEGSTFRSTLVDVAAEATNLSTKPGERRS